MDMLEIPKEDRDDGITENGDEEDINALEPGFLNAENNLATTLPATQHLQIRVFFITFTSLIVAYTYFQATYI